MAPRADIIGGSLSDEGANSVRRRDFFLLAALLSIAVLYVYCGVMNNGFVNYDDPLYVYENDMVIGGITIRGIAWAFTSVHALNWHPLTWLSHMFDVQLFGLRPAGHHLTNLLFHLANSLLLFALLRRMTGTLWRSLLVAALFALHPLHVESVAWIAERKDVLSTFFWILTMWAYVEYAGAGSIRYYLAALLMFVLGLLSKPMLVTLPMVLLLLDFWPLKRLDFATARAECTTTTGVGCKRLLLEKLPFLILAAASALVTYFVQKQAGGVLYDSPFSLNSGNAFISYVKYLIKTVWPHPLAVLYPFNPDEITTLRVVGAGLLLIVLSFLMLRAAKRHPYLAFGWFWYLVTLVPVIGFIRIGEHSIADRYTYVPLIGIFIMLVWGFDELRSKLHVANGIICALSLAILFILSYVTMRQVGYWRNSIALFEHAVAVTESNFTAHRNLGLAYGRLGNFEKASSEERISRLLGYQYKVRVFPYDSEAHYRLGISYYEFGRHDEAIEEYKKAIALKPSHVQAYNDMGIVLVRLGRLEEAKNAFRNAIRIAPGYLAPRHNLRELGIPRNRR